MSGPKVVRVVTRDEFVHICQGHLARLDAVRSDWAECGRRNDVLSEDEIATFESRGRELRTDLTDGRFENIEKRVLEEIAYLQRDREQRLARAIEQQVNARAQARRAESVAERLLASLDGVGRPIPVELRAELEEIAAGTPDANGALQRTFTLLEMPEPLGVTDRQRELAFDLRGETENRSFEKWCADHAPDREDLRLVEVERKLAELNAIVGTRDVVEFESRLATVEGSNDSARRSLLLDSLIADLSVATVKVRDRAAREIRVRSLAAELDEIGTDRCRAVANACHNAIEARSESLENFEMSASRTLAEAREELATAARRRVVLAGLAGLGYEVSEALETVLAREGKAIVRRATESGYGVEIAAPKGNDRFQMRVVAFREPEVSGRSGEDRDAETRFCGDVASLRERLASSGGDLVVEQARPVGTVPVKAVAVDADRRIDTVTIRQQRTLP